MDTLRTPIGELVGRGICALNIHKPGTVRWLNGWSRGAKEAECRRCKHRLYKAKWWFGWIRTPKSWPRPASIQ